jgi:hypothetical protein
MLEIVLPPAPSRRRRTTTGAKLALKPVHVWGVPIRLQVMRQLRDLALFDLTLDSKLRGCDLVPAGVGPCQRWKRQRPGDDPLAKTGRSVQFEVTEQTRRSISGSLSSGSTPPPTAFTACVERRFRCSTRLATCGPASSCWGTPS